MYKLLLVGDSASESQDPLSSLFTREENFGPVLFARGADEAAALLSAQRFDAVGVLPAAGLKSAVEACLRAASSPLPLFAWDRSDIAQVRDVRHLLNRLHADYHDQPLPQSEMVGIVAGDLVRNLLNGSLKDPQTAPRWLRMLRSPIDPDVPCRLYDLSMPQGEQYLGGRWHYGENRLESALCRSFFHQGDPACAYHLAFLDHTTARMLAIPLCGPVDSFDHTDKSVLHVIEDVKTYLDLDILVTGARTLPNLISAALPARDPH